MGTVSNAFSREIGKNAGKVVSNFLFGDSHSTPYRRVNNNQASSRSLPTSRLTQAEVQLEIGKARIAAEREIQREIQKKEEKEAKSHKIKELQKEIRDALSINSDTPTIETINELIGVLETKKWYPKKKKSEIVFNRDEEKLEEQRIHTQLSDIYLSKLTMCLKNSDVHLSKEKLKYCNKYLEQFEKRRLQELYGTLGSVVFFIKKISNSIVSKLNNSSVTSKFINELEVSNEKPELLVREDESIFFDLDENNRISNKLAQIWNKYSNSIDKNIINRKPIFSADGVVESILFVGINPSYDPNDDNVFLKSDDGNSMLYGSLYEREDAPEYFKKLEDFSKQLNKGYTHINLLYTRENNRDSLLNINNDFIREQLELTYDTILKIKPLAIFFFGLHCKRLIFGADRWIDPKSENNGHYILNGTNFPVFFSEDIALMEAEEKKFYINSLRLIIK